MDAVEVEELVEGAAEGGGTGGEEHGGAFEALGELLGVFGGEVFSTEEGDAGFAEEVVVGAELRAGADGDVGEDEVDAEGGEFSEEAVDFVFMGDDGAGGIHGEGGFEECGGDAFGDRVGDADVEFLGACVGSEFDGVEEFAAEVEDIVGVFEDELSDLGHDEGASAAFEEFFAEDFFEFVDLGGDGGAGEVEGFGGAGDAAFAGDGPEVHKVVVVEEGHRETPVRNGRGKWGKMSARDFRSIKCRLGIFYSASRSLRKTCVSIQLGGWFRAAGKEGY